MLCENCQAAEASVHLTQVTEDGVRKLHLCPRCAEQSGLDFQDPTSMADALLLGLGAGGQKESVSRTACPRCGLTRSDFKRTGRLGCAQCYATFRDELKPLIRAMHRSDRHTGKTLRSGSDPGPAVVDAGERSRLQAALEKAIATEAFEEAARIRDHLRQLDVGTGDGEPPAP